MGRGTRVRVGRRTSILAGDEVDVLAELDVEAGVAHEVLQPDAGDRPRRHRRRPRDASCLSPRRWKQRPEKGLR